jgi:hypothetical protein
MSIATLGRFEVVLAADLGFCFEAAEDKSPLLESAFLPPLPLLESSLNYSSTTFTDSFQPEGNLVLYRIQPSRGPSHSAKPKFCLSA